MDQDLARRTLIGILFVQLGYYVVLVYAAYSLWSIGELPEYLTGSSLHFELLVYTLVPLGFLIAGSEREHVRIFLYAVVFMNVALSLGYWRMHNLFGGSSVPAQLMSFLIIPAISILFLVRRMEFEPDNYEEAQFVMFVEEIAGHPTVEEGLDYVVSYIEERPDDFDSEYFDRLLEYLSNYNDEIGSAARARLRSKTLEDTYNFEH